MINSRKIEDLDADTAAKARLFIEECEKAGVDVIITSTYRDKESQAALYAQGRTAPGKKVTNAGPGKSYHNWRVAFDFVPVVAGKAMWSDNKLWSLCGAIGVQCGLEWGGQWKSFPDKPHMQNTKGRTIAQFEVSEHMRA